MHGVVDEQDYNDGSQNDPPIGNLSARYRCFAFKPFHDFPPRLAASCVDGPLLARVFFVRSTVACSHVSGLSVRSHMTAGLDGFRVDRNPPPQ